MKVSGKRLLYRTKELFPAAPISLLSAPHHLTIYSSSICSSSSHKSFMLCTSIRLSSQPPVRCRLSNGDRGAQRLFVPDLPTERAGEANSRPSEGERLDHARTTIRRAKGLYSLARNPRAGICDSAKSARSDSCVRKDISKTRALGFHLILYQLSPRASDQIHSIA